MISVGKLVRAEQTLADLVHEFESLAEKYHRAEESLTAGQSLDVHRRDVDSMCSISAGMCLLVAVERGFIRSADSAVWNLFDARTNRINNHIREFSRLQDSWKELADPNSSRVESLGYGNYFSTSDVAAYYLAAEPSAPLEPIDLDALRRKAESHLQEVTQLKTKLELESDLDPTSDEGQCLLMWTWTAFVRLELVPNHVSEFRPDWQERLVPPDFFAIHGVKDSGQRNQTRSLFEKVPGETKEDRHRYCVASRANIYATACRVIAKLLRTEIARRLSEIGRIQTSVHGGKTEDGARSTLASTAEAVAASDNDETVKLQPCERRAYYAANYTEGKLSRQLSAKEVWDYWREHGFDSNDRDTANANLLADYEVPDNFETFKSQLSRGRSAFKDKRKEDRKGRKGRSVAKADEL